MPGTGVSHQARGQRFRPTETLSPPSHRERKFARHFDHLAPLGTAGQCLVVFRLAQPHPRSSDISINELDACHLKHAADGLAIEAIVWALFHAIGLTQRNPSKRAKSPSVEHNVSPCSTANAAR